MPAKKIKNKQVNPAQHRLEVLKTYKLYIGGQFPRTESGRYYIATNRSGKKLANICLGSRKDIRDAVVSARTSLQGWAGKTAFNRSQILYRIAEMMEGRKDQFKQELSQMDYSAAQAEKEVTLSVDRLIYYAGWCDKYQQVLSSVNPVSSSHFNFSIPEPMGVIGLIAPQSSALLGLISLLAPAIAGGNTCIAIGSYSKPLCTITLAEVLHASDLPGGVVNLLTGNPDELIPCLSGHMDLNAVVYCEQNPKQIQLIREQSSLNVKRVMHYPQINWTDSDKSQSPYFILDLQEIKTTWHPIESIGSSSGNY